MILVRDVFQAQYGKADELVALFMEINEILPQYAARILTDVSGPFFTVVTEEEIESIDEWNKRNAEVFGTPEFGDWFARMMPLVVSGKREFYNIEG